MYDIAIIGAGPAGMTAALYARRAGIKTVIFEKAFPGGQMTYASSIENFPGYVSIPGFELAVSMKKQIEGVDYKTSEITGVDLAGDVKILNTANGTIEAKAVIIAAGAQNRKLDVPGEIEFAGRGVSYCAVCDGALYRNKNVVVVGGGNTALDDSLYLANFCESVTLLHRRDEFRGDKTTLEKVFKNPKIKILTNSVVTGIFGPNGANEPNGANKSGGSNSVNKIEINNQEELKADGIFIAVGQIPNTAFLGGAVTLSESSAVITGQNMRTNLDMVYAAGDVREKELKQILTACSDGALAVTEIAKRLR
jgi:thioredoxin reductase (NADPH)